MTYFSNSLGFVGLLCVILGDTLGFDFLGLGINLFVFPEKIDIIIINLLLLFFLFLRGGRLGSSFTGEDSTRAAGTGEGGELSLVGLDVFVPAGDVGVP